MEISQEGDRICEMKEKWEKSYSNEASLHLRVGVDH